MTSRERFLIALAGGVPDRIPITEHLFSLKLMQELLGYTTVLYDGKTQAKLATRLGIDAIWTSKKHLMNRMKFIKMNGG